MDKQFYALECECLDENGYDLKKISKNKDVCSHAVMISDKNLLKFVYLKSSKVNSSFEKIEDYPLSIKEAFDKYNYNNEIYVDNCNDILTNKNNHKNMN